MESDRAESESHEEDDTKAFVYTSEVKMRCALCRIGQPVTFRAEHYLGFQVQSITLAYYGHAQSAESAGRLHTRSCQSKEYYGRDSEFRVSP